jgi:hypothetical protein
MTSDDRLTLKLLRRALTRIATVGEGEAGLPNDPMDLLSHDERMAHALEAQAERLDALLLALPVSG